MCALCSLAGVAPGGLNCVEVSGDPGLADAAVVNAGPPFSLPQIIQQLRTQWDALAGVGYFEGTAEEGVAEFVTTGGRWRDAGTSSGSFTTTLGASGGVVAWSVAGAGLTNNTGVGFFTGSTVDMGTFLPFDYEAELRRAFDAWASVGNIEFIQVADGGGNIGNGTMPTIRIVGGFIDGENGSNILARGFFPSSSASGGDIVFDNGNTSFFSSVHNFFLTALHEIGHALGLNHQPAPPSGSVAIMNPSINTALDGLQPDDINGIRAVYGAQDFGPNSYFMPASQTNLTLFDAAPALTIVGNGLNNVIIGSSAGETFRGGGGHDAIDGSGGNDIAVFSGPLGAYTLTHLGGMTVRISGPDGTDTVFNVEQLRFDDQTIPSLRPDLAAGLTLSGRTATVITSNVGGPAGGSATGIYLSADDTVTTGDTALSTFAVPALDWFTWDTTLVALSFPGNLTPGTYYVGAIADTNGQVTEDNESNNITAVVAVILGNSGANTITGASANDTMFGLGGNDRLNGAAGADTLTGGVGADVLVFDATSLANATAVAPAIDRVTDYNQSGGAFNVAEGDQIDLSGILSVAYNHGSGQPVASLVRVVGTGTGTKLQVDTDGAANGVNWVTIAALDGVDVNDTLNIILDASQPAGVGVAVTAAAAPADFDGDLRSDILWQIKGGGLAIWEMNGTQVKAADYLRLGSAPVGAPGSDWHIVETDILPSDFDGDGKGDLLWRTDSGVLALWEMDGTQVKFADYLRLGSTTVSAPGSDWHIVITGDFDGDSKADVLWRTDSGVLAIWQMNGNQVTAADYLRMGSSVVAAPGTNWHVLGADDFDGDGKGDLLWKTDDGTLAIWKMDGTQIKGADYLRMDSTIVKTPGTDWHLVGTGDFDGDGRGDLLWRTNGGALAVWEMNGTQIKAAGYLTFGSAPVGAPGTDWHIYGTGDFDGDGRDDILWKTDGGTLAIWKMNGFDVSGADYLRLGSTPVGVPTTDWNIVQHHYDLV